MSAGTRRSITNDVREIMSAGAPWILAALFAAFTASFFAVFGFLPSLLVERLGVHDTTASVLTGIAVIASAGGNLAGGYLLAREIDSLPLLTVSFMLLALCGVGIFTTAVPGALAYMLSIAFSFISGLIPVVLIEAAPRYAPRPDLIGAALGLAMQGNNVGLMAGPAATGAVAAMWGWPYVSIFIAVLAVIATALVFLLRARPSDEVRQRIHEFVEQGIAITITPGFAGFERLYGSAPKCRGPG